MTAKLVYLLPMALLAASLGGGASSVADDPKPTSKAIPAAEAKDHLDKEGTFELVVRTSKDAEKRKEFYLDSEEDFHDPKNLAIVIAYEHLDAFKKLKIDDPSKHYLNKTIRVTGTPKRESSQIRIRIEDPKNIKIVEAK